MFPLLVDMTEEESWKVLRFLELEAYSSLVTALRAQGSLDSNKMKFIKEASNILHISEERFKSELKRVVLDERLNTVAYYVSGSTTTWEDWIQEGRSVIPPLQRAMPQTAYSAIADQVAEDASKNNDLLPLPVYTERKRGSSFSQSSGAVFENSKNVQFRVPEAVKTEDCKKRKFSYGLENTSLSHHHLMNAPKPSRIQQIYRQKTKAKIKEQQQQLKSRQQEQEQQKNYQQSPHQLHQKYNPAFKPYKLPLSPQTHSHANSPKINILQNISLANPNTEETIELIKNEIDSYMAQKSPIEPNNPLSQQQQQPGCSNENEAPKNANNIKPPPPPSQNYRYIASSSPSTPVVGGDVAKTVKVCPVRKTAAKTTPTGQKLIIVSNPQTITTPSILQRTLTIPFVKNISMKNFDKFKIVSTSGATPVTLNLTAVTSTGSANPNAISKHKVLSLRTNASGKKIISLSHLQALTKGGIKMLPLGTKLITTKGPIINSSTPPLYIMNSMGNAQTITKSTLTTPLMVSSKIQTTIKNDNNVIQNETGKNEGEEDNPIGKPVVLTGMLKSSESDDIESQITQLTEIPQTTTVTTTIVEQKAVEEEQQHSNVEEVHEIVETGEEFILDQSEEVHGEEIVHDTNHFIEEHEIEGTEEAVCDEGEFVQEEGVVIGEEDVIVQESVALNETLVVDDSGDNYIIIDKSSDIHHYEEETNSLVSIGNFEEGSNQKPNVEFDEIEIATENNCAKVQTNIC